MDEDEKYFEDCLTITEAMGIPTHIIYSEGEKLVFVTAKDFVVGGLVVGGRSEQYLPVQDMDQNMRIFNWLCEHGTLSFKDKVVELNLPDETFEVTGDGKGLFRQQLIFDLAALFTQVLKDDLKTVPK